MNIEKTIAEINELEKEIALLPAGGISSKKVRGKNYYYYRVTENGKRIETYIDFAKVPDLRAQIEKRKTFEARLKELRKALPVKAGPQKSASSNHSFKTYIRIGEDLDRMIAPVKKFRHRECYRELRDFVFGERANKGCRSPEGLSEHPVNGIGFFRIIIVI